MHINAGTLYKWVKIKYNKKKKIKRLKRHGGRGKPKASRGGCKPGGGEYCSYHFSKGRAFAGRRYLQKCPAKGI